MTKVKVFLLCFMVMLAVFSGITCMEVYSLERTMARSVFNDLLDDMQDIGYLDEQLANYYEAKMTEWGWIAVDGNFFQGSWPVAESSRALKERNEQVTVHLSIQPSLLTKWVHLLIEGEPEFRFAGSRTSEYFAQGW